MTNKPKSKLGQKVWWIESRSVEVDACPTCGARQWKMEYSAVHGIVTKIYFLRNGYNEIYIMAESPSGDWLEKNGPESEFFATKKECIRSAKAR